MNSRRLLQILNNRAFTILELMIVVIMLPVLVGVVILAFNTVLKSWNSSLKSITYREDIEIGVDKMSRALRESEKGSLTQYNSISHTLQFDEVGGDTYVYYLYNASDTSFDSTYSEDLYALKKADITSGQDPSSGDGVVILRDVVSPDAASPATSIIIGNGRIVTLDLVVQRFENKKIRFRQKVRARNQPI